MGHIIENYNFDELHRIAVPGTVTPSLFWVLPVGKWHLNELERAWNLFTRNKGVCNDYGLLLVKQLHKRESENSEISLMGIGATLKELMPAGTEGFVTSSDFHGNSRRLLVLSGSYPQPGWGVLAEWDKDIYKFENIIRCVIDKLSVDEKFTKGLESFKNASTNYQRWKFIGSSPDRENLNSLDRKILDAEKVSNSLQDIYTALINGDHDLAKNKLSDAIFAAKSVVWLDINEHSFQKNLNSLRMLEAATYILAISANCLSDDVEPLIEPLLSNQKTRGAIFCDIKSKQIKKALQACIRLRENGCIESGSNFRMWAEQTLKQVPDQISADLTVIEQDINDKLIILQGEKANRERKYKLDIERWRNNSRIARESYHQSVDTITEFQWNCGPKFLVAFEDICRMNSFWVRSIPWDPARMVGWKIMTGEVNLETIDLQSITRDFTGESFEDILGNCQLQGLADGSAFTDYVHHIAISKPNISPRTITRDLTARLLRPSELERLIRSYGGKIPENHDNTHLADELIDSFGWRRFEEVREKPLAGCIKKDSKNTLELVDTLSGNDLRVILESFCKDIIDVVVARLGYSYTQLWEAIEEKVPNYHSSSINKDWDEEIEHLTIGAAVILLPALAPLAFPNRLSTCLTLADNLKKLSKVLNASSHHRGENSHNSKELVSVPELIRQVLEDAKTLVGELPWHLNPSFIYGKQPKILSGEAWSHGSSASRMIRVILWTEIAFGNDVLLWNTTRRNPIITDPIFINRQRRLMRDH